ncbi:hypothetical protein NECAME_10359 [Necator americanus]|uniref:Uncharacterized protein n=1 Tax=Necator americanus TaxID=51031 RepID=W2T978_NECAM|nr:hypothetical protein NECAME_10359 [Necator americanus]ETN78413.1 hypothetical protein NECAME_10359 [Necator americanus]
MKLTELLVSKVNARKLKDWKALTPIEDVRLREKGFRSMTDIREEVKADLINTSTRQLGFAQKS